MVGWTVNPFRIDDLFVFNLIADLTTDSAEGAQRINLSIRIDNASLVLIEEHRRHKCSGWASLHAFAAGDAARFPHGIVEVEHDFRVMVAVGHANHIIDLNFAAPAQAEAALDAGIKIDAHGRMTGIANPACRRGEAAFCDLHATGPIPKLRIWIV